MRTTLVLVGLLFGFAAAAEKPAEPLYETRVVGHHKRRADDPAGFTSVIEIKDPTPGTRLPEVLAEVPGARFKDTGLAGRQTLSLRGAGAHQVAVFLDGIRLTSPGDGGVDLSLFDPAHLGAAEIHRSAGATRFGADALGGVLVLKTPLLRMRPHTSAAVGYGSYESIVLRGSRSASVGKRWRYLGSGSYRQGTGDFPFVDENGVQRRRANNDWRGGELLVKVDRVSPHWHLVALSSLGVVERGAPGPSQRPSPDARQQDVRNLVGLRAARFDLVDVGDELSLSLYHRYGFFRFEDPQPPAVLSRNHRFAAGSDARWKLPLGEVGRFEAGVDLRADFFRDDVVSDDGVSAADRVGLGLWVSSQTRLLDGMIVVAPAVRLAMASGFSPTVVPRGGIVLRPFSWTSSALLGPLEVTGNVGRSFRHPSFQEMYVRLDGFSGNPQLRAEDALLADVGLRWHGDRVSLEAAYFRRWINNTILFAPVSPVMVRPDNYSGVAVSGVESAIEIEPGLGLQLRGAYTFTRSSFGDPPSSLPGQPRHRLAGRLRWRAAGCLPRGHNAARWLGGLRLYIAATFETSMVLGRFNSLPEQGRVLLSAGAAYRYRFLQLSAEGRNLLDKRDARDLVGFPLPPGRLFVSLTASF